ncbi:rod shape-determining protein MreD [Novosphingobium sp. FSW06-99]|uniref:rod shape-determining protein MreD n=1 Tax=Novosphingobium sp. FSW06-99 TaxID=1739113 RepID=UPI00076D2585|nr:rod shape-determining protein MreD [Novosphingobium sp. FSW06-99]KUR77434.1 rod shape-determining protein MreD [Novosphingobium sp. FSW06-99]
MAQTARPASTRLVDRRDVAPRRPINRAPLPWLAAGLPWVSIMAMSLVTFSPVIASAPVIPPFAFMTLLAWRMLRPSFLPVWAGLPLGAWDDLFSGQPFGSAIVLWSAAMLAMDVIDERFLWRGFRQDWLAAAVLLSAYLVLASGLAGVAAHYPLPLTIGPQWLMTVVLFPVVNRLVALLDKLRLLPLRRL